MVRKTKSFNSHKNSLDRIGITTGDPKGVGWWVVQKSLERIKVKKRFQFVIWTSKQAKTFRTPRFKTHVFKHVSEALATPFSPSSLLQIKSSSPPGVWLEDCAKSCLNQTFSAMVTAPLSKTLLQKSHPGFLGQTHLLKKLSKTPSVFMVFLGQKFHVVLLNDHCPYFKTKLQHLSSLISLLSKWKPLLASPSKKKLPFALLGLNPHAGEQGLLGKEEETFKKFLPLKSTIGPLPSDTAFLKKNWKKFSFYIALYHDQGLIPFKLIHSHTGCGFSLGLPFIRTGVSHGTGAGLKSNEISSDSFYKALQLACSMVVKKKLFK